jgi:hypothetical protein
MSIIPLLHRACLPELLTKVWICLSRPGRRVSLASREGERVSRFSTLGVPTTSSSGDGPFPEGLRALSLGSAAGLQMV